MRRRRVAAEGGRSSAMGIIKVRERKGKEYCSEEMEKDRLRKLESEYRVLRTGGERIGHARNIRGWNRDLYGLQIWVPMADHFFQSFLENYFLFLHYIIM